MRKLKSQIIYSSVRVDTVLNSNKSTQWWKIGTEPISIFNHNKAVHALSVQIWCPFSTDQVEKNSMLTLKHTHSLSYTHRNILKFLLITVCWEQYISLIQIYGTPSVLFPVRSGKNQFNCKEYILFPGHRQLWWK